MVDSVKEVAVAAEGVVEEEKRERAEAERAFAPNAARQFPTNEVSPVPKRVARSVGPL
jgi:hypothetical protein